MGEKEPPSDLNIQLDSLIKTKEKLSREYIEDKWVGGFIIKRFITFCSWDINVLKNLVPYINNIKISDIEDNWDQYLYLFYTLPHLPNAEFYYVGKGKGKKPKENKELEEKINLFADILEISKRESKYLLENKYIDVKL